MAYEPETVPDDVDLLDWIGRELRRVASEFAAGADHINLPELHVEPLKPRTGVVVLADGTDWNPGSGAGFYGYRGGAWQLLG